MHSGISAMPSPLQTAYSQQSPRAQFPSHHFPHRDGMTPSLCTGPSLKHDGFCCLSAPSQNKIHAAPTTTRATAP